MYTKTSIYFVNGKFNYMLCEHLSIILYFKKSFLFIQIFKLTLNLITMSDCLSLRIILMISFSEITGWHHNYTNCIPRLNSHNFINVVAQNVGQTQHTGNFFFKRNWVIKLHWHPILISRIMFLCQIIKSEEDNYLLTQSGEHFVNYCFQVIE